MSEETFFRNYAYKIYLLKQDYLISLSISELNSTLDYFPTDESAIVQINTDWENEWESNLEKELSN